MKRQLAAAAALAGMIAIGSISPALAHHPEVTDEGGNSTLPNKYEGLEVKYDRDWVLSSSSTGKGKGSEKGNAPGTSAPCIDGMAADFFPCDGIDLLSHVSHNELGTSFVNDIWGWTDPSNRKDYALVGATNGTVFVDISDAKRPQVLGILPTASTAGGSTWRDIKVYKNHAYVVSEHTNHGIQVFDLTRLRDWDGTYTTYDVDARYTGHGSAHNLNINEETGFLYSVGAGPFSSGGLPNTVTVDAPSAAAGTYGATSAVFGPPPPVQGLSGTFALVDDGSATPSLGCAPFVDFPAGAIAIVDRGTCGFTVKVANAQAAGAAAVVVANTAGAPITMGGADPSITIPSVMVSQADGAVIKAGLPATGTVAANDPPPLCGTGLHMVDINDPTNPTFAGCFDGHGYIHDTQCIVYDGPDADYTGREICFNSNATTSGAGGLHRVAIVDVTDKSNPVSIAREGYANDGYSHQGWLTPDRRFFLHGDELDEQRRGINTTTRVWDVSDLDNIVEIQAFANDTTSIDHNIYTQGRYAYASNYTSGLRVYDTRDLAGGGLSEAAFFDLYPENDNTTFEGGTWSNYAYFGQKGVVAASSIDRGLFILQPRLSRQGN
ncbi:choice-of-anchor B family protein [Nostocoides sp. F2B08]|uniref:choice-of-anchor B family protein n=1 Tax=Nostocoides sp. F2B08 TaxID=2653936 RepID=UPI0012635E7D|nr:choice-of-anchor B family protein [Tetrasphaera sp. F2B08]KAB7745972.1 choice-of-anchor B family protein [Tetrasphaera sp. F2B08]